MNHPWDKRQDAGAGGRIADDYIDQLHDRIDTLTQQVERLTEELSFAVHHLREHHRCAHAEPQAQMSRTLDAMEEK